MLFRKRYYIEMSDKGFCQRDLHHRQKHYRYTGNLFVLVHPSRMEILLIQKHKEGEEEDKSEFVEISQINLTNKSTALRPFPPLGGSLSE